MQGEQIRFRKDGLETVEKIVFILEKKGPQSKTSISRMLKRSKSTISDLIDRMKQAGALKTKKRKLDRPGRPEDVYNLRLGYSKIFLQQMRGRLSEFDPEPYERMTKKGMRSTINVMMKRYSNEIGRDKCERYALAWIEYWLSEVIGRGCKISFESEEQTLNRLDRLGEQIEKALLKNKIGA